MMVSCWFQDISTADLLQVSPVEAQKLVPGLRLFPDFLSEEEGAVGRLVLGIHGTS